KKTNNIVDEICSHLSSFICHVGCPSLNIVIRIRNKVCNVYRKLRKKVYNRHNKIRHCCLNAVNNVCEETNYAIPNIHKKLFNGIPSIFPSSAKPITYCIKNTCKYINKVLEC